MNFFTKKEYGVGYRYQKIKGDIHPVFKNLKDFEKYFMKKDGAVPIYKKNWRTAEKDDWVIADDGGVVQVLARNPIKQGKKTKYYVRTIVGSFVCLKGVFMDTDFKQHISRHQFGKKVPNDWTKRHAAQKEKLEAMFAIAICLKIYLGKVTEEEIIQTYKKIFKYNKKDISSKAFKLLNSERVKNIMNENIQDIAKKEGMTFEWFIRGVKDVADNASNDKVRLEGYMAGGKIIGAIGEEKQQDRLAFDDIDDAEFENIERPKEIGGKK